MALISFPTFLLGKVNLCCVGALDSEGPDFLFVLLRVQVMFSKLNTSTQLCISRLMRFASPPRDRKDEFFGP